MNEKNTKNSSREQITTENTSFSAIIDRADHLQKMCSDHYIENVSRYMKMNDLGRLQFESGNTIRTMPMTPWSLYQLGDKTGIPSSYLEKCISNGYPELAAQNVNTWLGRKDTGMIVRVCDNHVRGLVSEKYTMLDTPDVLSRVFSVVPEKNWDIKGSYMSEERLHLRLVAKEDLGLGDPLFPSVFIDTSDVGRCALSIKFGIYRLVCTNGLIIPEAAMHFRIAHMGRSIFAMTDSLEGMLENLPVFMDNAKTLVQNAREKNISMVTEDDLKAVTGVLTKNLQAPISTADAENIIDITKTKYLPTKWGLVNAITEYAQTKTLDTRIEYEKAAGRLLAA